MTSNNTPWLDRLKELGELEDGWYDGYGYAINPEALKFADRMLHKTHEIGAKTPGIFPSIDEGYGLTLEWVEHTPSGRILMVSLYITNELNFEVLSHAINSDGNDSNSFEMVETASYEEALIAVANRLKAYSFLC